MKLAFDYDNSKNKGFDLYLYIKSNLYEKSIAIETGGKIEVFNWYYSPQTSGTYKQKETYQRTTIENMVQKIINTINKNKLKKSC